MAQISVKALSAYMISRNTSLPGTFAMLGLDHKCLQADVLDAVNVGRIARYLGLDVERLAVLASAFGVPVVPSAASAPRGVTAPIVLPTVAPWAVPPVAALAVTSTPATLAVTPAPAAIEEPKLHEVEEEPEIIVEVDESFVDTSTLPVTRAPEISPVTPTPNEMLPVTATETAEILPPPSLAAPTAAPAAPEASGKGKPASGTKPRNRRKPQ